MEPSDSHKIRMQDLLEKLSSFKTSEETAKKTEQEEAIWFEKTIENVATQFAKYTKQSFAYAEVTCGYPDYRNHKKDYAEKIKKYFIDQHFNVEIKIDDDEDCNNFHHTYSLMLYKRQ
jgi:hypothetical protein